MGTAATGIFGTRTVAGGPSLLFSTPPALPAPVAHSALRRAVQPAPTPASQTQALPARHAFPRSPGVAVSASEREHQRPSPPPRPLLGEVRGEEGQREAEGWPQRLPTPPCPCLSRVPTCLLCPTDRRACGSHRAVCVLVHPQPIRGGGQRQTAGPGAPWERQALGATEHKPTARLVPSRPQ